MKLFSKIYLQAKYIKKTFPLMTGKIIAFDVRRKWGADEGTNTQNLCNLDSLGP